MKKIILTTALIIAGIAPMLAQHSDTLHPIADAYLVTMGGGGGKNTFMKFNISSIPQRSVVSSATLMVYVSYKSLNWDSDCKFMNVNSQTWAEGDNETTLWNLQRTDTIMQMMGFGMSLGWTSSVDLKQIFLRDYKQSNSFCSMMLKDPDDPTVAPGGGNAAKNLKDSLMTGNIFNDYIIYYPREATNQNYIPRFIIKYKIAPTVTSQPTDRTVCEGSNTTFSVTASGDTTLKYQWQKNGSDISNATSSSYSINSISVADAGKYRCIVTNSVGTDTSIYANLNVNALPSAFNVTGGGSYCTGGNGVAIGLSGSDAGINYKLRANGSLVTTVVGTGSTIDFGNQLTASNYTVIAINASTSCKNMMTGNTNVIINNLPSHNTSAYPDNNICQGSCCTLNATGGTSYTWSSGNTSVCPQNTTTYTVTVTDNNGCSTIDSVIVNVSVCTGFTENVSQQKVLLGPNPFSKFTEITSDKNFNNAELDVYDMEGNLVKQIKNINSNTIFVDRHGIANGTYYYKISEKNIQIASGKFIVD